ncbi:hypothetical protein GBA65_03980 [Rubrobacter marinus]|uniref:5'-Nucleotidase C-terminal domain-containing protein n=1 Tax=Rubrobacter marinus TaxID=2653852 RepID=A0A6G8PTZ9_9ACTN|nr:hypothetical protein GBA65_03980 [Rubrobacter marinus]
MSGLRYAVDPGRPEGRRVLWAMLEDGRPMDRGATYTVAADAFLAGGGDGFAAFGEGRNPASPARSSTPSPRTSGPCRSPSPRPTPFGSGASPHPGLSPEDSPANGTRFNEEFSVR